jgi:tetratricopeptide (TPR) repeat protein
MSNQNFDETIPNHINDDTAPLQVQKPGEPSKKPRRWPWILGGIILVILLGAVGAYLGYRAAVQARMQQMSNQVALVATTQFQLGLQDLEAGRLKTARQRFEYVISVDPKFPGAVEKLSEVMLQLANIATPTVEATPTIMITSTPDNRGKDELYNSIQQLMRAKDWDKAIITLDGLRNLDIDYHPLEVDGMYYIALRNRGINKIVLNGNLEGGMYDLALMERFGPMDKEADGYRNVARMYLSGASFWEIDWTKVLDTFSQIYASLPNLRDGSGVTAAERFRIASMKYGDQLAAKEDYCGARDQYRNSLGVAQDNNLSVTATAVQKICQPPTPTAGAITPTVGTTLTTPLATTATTENPPAATTAAPAATTAVPPTAETPAPATAKP